MITDIIIFVLKETTLGFYTSLKVTNKVLKFKICCNRIVQRRQKSMCLAAASVIELAAAKLLLVRWRPGICMKILAFEVICRVIVMLV
jgi:hypothetical protein